jgi:hypothetical protein
MSKALDNEMKTLSDSEMKELDSIVKKHVAGGGQVGSGFISKLIKKIKKKRKAITKKVVDTGKKVAVKGIEKLTGCKDKKTEFPYNYKKLPNEGKHQTFKSEDGCLYSAQWSGPGTRVVPKITALWKKYNGDIRAMTDRKTFAHPVDRQAMAHDLAYLIAGVEQDKDKKYQMIRTADERFIRRLKNIKGINSTIPLNAMRAKVLFEKAGGKQYSGEEKSTDEDIDRAKKLLAALQQSGEGKSAVGTKSRSAAAPRVAKKESSKEYDNIIDALQGRGSSDHKLDRIIEMLEKISAK